MDNQKLNDRIEEAVKRAQEGFWEVIAEAFPEVQTGDFSPEDHFNFFAHCADAVEIWYESNKPKEPRLIEDIAETWIKTASQAENTGGNIYNDIITLKNGFIIRISEDGIGIYKNEQNDQDGETVAFANF